MKFASLLASLALAAASSAATLSYDTVYDNAKMSLDVVACSDGSNGMINKGFTTFGSLPSFPRIGSASAIAGYNSANCGTCWKVRTHPVTPIHN